VPFGPNAGQGDNPLSQLDPPVATDGLPQLPPITGFGAGGFGDLDDADKILVFASFTEKRGGQPARLFVSAKLGPKWHIYSLSQPAGAAKATAIELDPSDQYQLLGSFVPDQAAEVRETEFFDVPLEEHYGTVTFSAPIEITTGVDASELRIAGKLSGMLCHDEQGCLQLADVDTGFSAQLATGQEAEDLLALVPTPGGEPAGYRAEDTHAVLTGYVTPQTIEPGTTATLVITAKVDPGWKIYAYTEKTVPDGISKPFRIALQQPAGWEIRPATASAKAKSEEIEGFPPYYYHEGSVTWTGAIEIPSDAQPGEFTFEGLIGYQTCSNQCDPPVAAKFSARVNVATSSVPGQSALVFSPFPSYDEVESLADAAAKRRSLSESVGEMPAASAGLNLEEIAESTAEQYQGISTWFFVLVVLPVSFGGGFLLNFMPCVLPVLGLKIMGFVSQAGESRGRIFMLNVWFALGLFFVFMVLATPMALLNAADVTQSDGGTGWGWGEQFNYDGFNIPLIAVVFVMALSFFGVWEIPIPGFATGSSATQLAEKEGFLGAFSKGVITTLLATPCTGPGIGIAIVWCAFLPAHLVYVVFAAIALGMASPYLVIGAFPALIRYLPKPGAWMETFKQAMAFVLLGTIVWLFTFIHWANMVPTLALLFGLWAACWWIGRVPLTAESSKRARAWVVAAAFATFIGLFAFSPGIEIGGFPIPGLAGIMEHRFESTLASVSAETEETSASEFELPWQRFSLAKLDELTAENRTVMVDFTANWCLTCKTLEQFVLNTRDVRQVVDRNGVVPLVADWSNRDRESDVGKAMRALGSKQVPVLAIFPAGRPNDPIVLRSGYTKGGLIKALEEAGPSQFVTEDPRAAMR
jgi:thiol:disulfide interchange protein